MEVLWLVLAAIGGSLITSLVYSFRSVFGILRIDRTNPQKDVYRFDIEDLDKIYKKKYVWLKIDKNADLSQK